MNPVHVVRKRRLAAWAKKNGVAIPEGFRVSTPTFGSPARELVRRIERKAFGPEQVSGRWSKRLGDLVKPRETLQDRVVRIASREVGVTESPAGSNDGPRVREYQRTTGAYAAPWCASFVTWALGEAGKRLEGFNTAYCPSWVDAARAGRNSLRVIRAADARPGDVVLFDWQRDGTSDHIGILTTGVDSSGDFRSVEGNTSVAGSQSNGGAVLIRPRNARDVLIFARVSA